MRLSFSTNAFVRFPVHEAVELIGLAGYDGVELLADTPHLYAPSVTEPDLDKVRRALDNAGLEVANLNANTARGFSGGVANPLLEPSLSSADGHRRRWRVDYTKKCIDICRELDGKNISVTSGPLEPGSTPEEAIELFRGSMEELADYAGEKEVRVGIEYEPGFLLEYSEELANLLEEISSPWIGANLDLGHSYLLGEEPAEVAKALNGRIFHMHIEDIKDGRHHHLIPGTGDMDFESMLGAFDGHYRGFYTVELYTYPEAPFDAARRAIEYLRKLESLLPSSV